MINNFEMDFQEVVDNINKFIDGKLLVLRRQPFDFNRRPFDFILKTINKAINDEIGETDTILPTDIYHQCNHLLHYFIEELLLYNINGDMEVYMISWANLISNYMNIVKEVEDNRFVKRTLQSKCTMIYQLIDTTHTMTNLTTLSKSLLRYYQRVSSHQNSSYNLSESYLDNIRKSLK